MGEGKAVELAIREYVNVQDAGNVLPGGQRRWKFPGNGLES